MGGGGLWQNLIKIFLTVKGDKTLPGIILETGRMIKDWTSTSD